MMMITHRDKKGRIKKRITVFLVVTLLVYGLFFSPVASFFSSVTHTVMTPFWSVGHSLQNSMSPFLSYFSSRRLLWIQNRDLNIQINSMAAKAKGGGYS